MNILSIVETAYRATVEEQDDTILWLNHSLKNSGAEISLLLRGSAVNYAVRGQEPATVAFGDRAPARAPALDQDLEKLIRANVPVYVIDEDLGERGLQQHRLINGLTRVARGAVPALLTRFDHVWHW